MNASLGYFRQFDYGWYYNYEKYGSWSPPHYDLSKVTAPVSLHYSLNDWISNESDVRILGQTLPNMIGKYRLPHTNFNHADYLWARDVRKMLYFKLLSLINRETDAIIKRNNAV
uniref:Lipase n=1 Tax=Trichogramma kaykai TaxID=54128 RepID=A0ABD2WE30_9HYME